MCKISVVINQCYMLVLDHCGDLEPPVNGEVSADNTTVGSTATYSCNEGYRLRGESTRNCQGDAVWSGEPPVCECEFYSVST